MGQDASYAIPIFSDTTNLGPTEVSVTLKSRKRSWRQKCHLAGPQCTDTMYQANQSYVHARRPTEYPLQCQLFSHWRDSRGSTLMSPVLDADHLPTRPLSWVSDGVGSGCSGQWCPPMHTSPAGPPSTLPNLCQQGSPWTASLRPVGNSSRKGRSTIIDSWETRDVFPLTRAGRLTCIVYLVWLALLCVSVSVWRVTSSVLDAFY